LSGKSISHTFAAGGIFTVRVTATDKDGGTSAATSFAVTQNSPPVDPLNELPITVSQGNSLILAAVGWTDPENDPLSYSWDVDGDGQFNDATGATATLTWNDLM